MKMGGNQFSVSIASRGPGAETDGRARSGLLIRMQGVRLPTGLPNLTIISYKYNINKR